MNLPTEVKVGARQYRILCESTDQMTWQNLSGIISYNNGTIYIKPDLCLDQEIEVLFHELIHALFTDSGADRDLPDGLEETLVCALTPRFMALIVDNPELFKNLLETFTV